MPNELCQRCDKEMANTDGGTFCIFKFLLRENHRIADEMGSINKFWKEQQTNCTHCFTMTSRKKQGKKFRRNYIMGYINSTIDETSSSTRSRKATRPTGHPGALRTRRTTWPTRGLQGTKGDSCPGRRQGPKGYTGAQGPKGEARSQGVLP